MDTIYQRGNIKDESHYDVLYQGGKKHGGSLSLIGVNTFS
jgi:hypothetical protein